MNQVIRLYTKKASGKKKIILTLDYIDSVKRKTKQCSSSLMNNVTHITSKQSGIKTIYALQIVCKTIFPKKQHFDSNDFSSSIF